MSNRFDAYAASQALLCAARGYYAAQVVAEAKTFADAYREGFDAAFEVTGRDKSDALDKLIAEEQPRNPYNGELL